MSDYQVTPQVVQLQAERENCVAYGNDARVAQIDRQLADLGVAAEKRAAAAEGDEEARKTPPKSRRSKEAITGSADVVQQDSTQE